MLEPSGGFLQVSGAKVYYDTTLPAEKRILRIEIKNKETGAYEALDLAKTYYLTTNDFLAAGGDGYTMLGGAREEGPSMDVAFAEYLESADLTAYAAINPNSRTISMSASKDTDGDGYTDIEEIQQGTDPKDAASKPGQSNPANPTNPTNPANPTNPTNPTVPTRPSNPVAPSQPNHPVVPETKPQEQPSVEKPNTAQPAANKATYQAPAQVRPTEVASKQGTLPKTGSKNPFLLSMFGLVFGMLGAAGLKKTQKD